MTASQIARAADQWKRSYGRVTYDVYRPTRNSDGAGGSIDIMASAGTCAGRIVKDKVAQRQESGLIRSVDSWRALLEWGADVSAGDILRPATPDGWEYAVLGVDSSRSDATHLEANVERRVWSKT